MEFKRHQLVKIKVVPDPEYVEYHETDAPEQPLKRGMLARVNIMLPNGRYHVEILNPDNTAEVLAYAPFDAEQLEPADE